MQRFVVGLFLVVALAGCSDSNGINAHVLRTSDLGDGYTYADIEEGAGAQFATFLNLTTNPGRGDVRLVTEDGGANATALYVALIRYQSDDQLVLSAAVAFRTAADADAWIDDEGLDECEEGDTSAAYRAGRFVSIHDGSSLPEAQLHAFHDALDRLERRTGATSLCGPAMEGGEGN